MIPDLGAHSECLQWTSSSGGPSLLEAVHVVVIESSLDWGRPYQEDMLKFGWESALEYLMTTT
jgi:hypothetical protein